jgi:hypothetical protein
LALGEQGDEALRRAHRPDGVRTRRTDLKVIFYLGGQQGT